MLQEILKDHRTGQDSTQLGNFVLGGRTPWGTYKQSVRELYKRIRGIRQLETEKDLLLIDIEEIEEKIAETEQERKKRRLQIELRQKQGQLEEMTRGLQDVKREAATFYGVCAELKKELGEIDEEKRAKLDREEWKWWHLKKAAMDRICSGRVSEVVIKNLCSLPMSEREEWTKIIKNPDVLINMLEKSEYGRELNYVSDDKLELTLGEINDNNLGLLPSHELGND